MKLRKIFLAGFLFTCALAVAVGKGITLPKGHWRPDASQELFGNSKSEMRVDEELFAVDIDELRRSLRYHLESEQIARLRYLVRQDWRQIVADRRRIDPSRWKQAPNLVNRRRQRSAPRS